MGHRHRVALVMVLALASAACAASSTSTGSPAAGGPSSSAAPSAAASGPAGGEPAGPSASAGASSPAPAAVVLTQPWATAQLTDVRTGETFRIADLVAEGRVVFLETMAIWCSNCRRQQQEAVTALAGLDRTRVTWVGIDVEASESADALARYSEDNGFDFTYAIADPDLARALVADFGDQILNPPSVNVVVIGTDGRVTASRGHKSAADIAALAADHGA